MVFNLKVSLLSSQNVLLFLMRVCLIVELFKLYAFLFRYALHRVSLIFESGGIK